MARKIDVTKLLNDSNYTKSDFAKAVGVSRPTLNKSFEKLTSTGVCSHKGLMILFSRLDDYECVSRQVVDKEIENSKKALIFLAETFKNLCSMEFEIEVLENTKDDGCERNGILEHIDELEAQDQNNKIKDLFCKHCGSRGTLRQKGPNGKIICIGCKTEYEASELLFKKDSDCLTEHEPEEIIEDKYKVGDIVECSIIKILDYGLRVRFGEHEGFIHREQYSKELKESTQFLGQKFKARLKRIANNKYSLSVKGIQQNFN